MADKKCWFTSNPLVLKKTKSCHLLIGKLLFELSFQSSHSLYKGKSDMSTDASSDPATLKLGCVPCGVSAAGYLQFISLQIHAITLAREVFVSALCCCLL